MQAEHGDAFTRGGLLHYFPELAAESQAGEILGLVNYTVNYGYFRPGRDLEWSRRLTPGTLTWEQFLRATGWRGERTPFGGSHS